MRYRIDDQLEGDQELSLVTIDGRRIVVARHQGRFFALDDACPHAGCSLAQGELEANELTCLCHGSRFDVASGDVLDGPAEEPAATVEVVVSAGTVWVEL